MMYIFFFFNDTATTEIYTLSLHDALPISRGRQAASDVIQLEVVRVLVVDDGLGLFVEGAAAIFGSVSHTCLRGVSRGFGDRKSTRLNSSHANISYAVFCLKKKKTKV